MGYFAHESIGIQYQMTIDRQRQIGIVQLNWQRVELPPVFHFVSLFVLFCLRCIAHLIEWFFFGACLADFFSVLEFFQPISHIGAWHTRNKCTSMCVYTMYYRINVSCQFGYDNDAHKNLENGISKMRFTLTLNTTRACDHMECCSLLLFSVLLSHCFGDIIVQFSRYFR